MVDLFTILKWVIRIAAVVAAVAALVAFGAVWADAQLTTSAIAQHFITAPGVDTFAQMVAFLGGGVDSYGHKFFAAMSAGALGLITLATAGFLWRFVRSVFA